MDESGGQIKRQIALPALLGLALLNEKRGKWNDDI